MLRNVVLKNQFLISELFYSSDVDPNKSMRNADPDPLCLTQKRKNVFLL